MFTGLVQGVGEIRQIRHSGDEARLTIQTQTALQHPTVGESIAVNGVCLTAESFGNGSFTAYASAETLECTSLGKLGAGALVNLEQALAVGDRLGGHLVSGHVDCVAVVSDVSTRGSSLVCRVSFPALFAAQVLPKGSVALDGISLTINACGPDWLEVNIIPETQKATTMRLWKKQSLVNMETDMIGKYVGRFLAVQATQPTPAADPARPSSITLERLRELGF